MKLLRFAIVSILALALLPQSAKAQGLFGGLKRGESKPGGEASGPVDSSINDTARYLGGLTGNPRGDLSVPRSSAEWKTHQGRMDSLWNQHSGLRGKLQGFKGQLSGLTSPGVLFYPFGGPDYVHAATLFPGASSYVLVGLEGTETMPDLAKLSGADLTHGIHGVANSLRTVMGASYFITTEMRADLGATSLKGTLPLLLAQVARQGQSVSSVEAISLDGGGNVVPRSGFCPGWLIKAGGKSIYYFRQDLSNGGLGDARILTFVSRQGGPVTFVKSASYLMHESNFSKIRDFVATKSRGIVQDPSGVPFANLVSAGWQLSLYGNYVAPLDTFASHPQPDLVTAYTSGSYSVKPLTFGLGYLLDPKKTSIIVARR